jgi:hypothetical protein
MYSRAGRLALAAALVTAPAAAQTVTALRARADSLTREWRQANALADLQDSLRLVSTRAGRDTIRVGTLTILSNPSPLPVAEAAARAWPVIDRLYGAAARSLTEHPIVIEAVDPDTTLRAPPLGAAVQIKWNLPAPALTQWLLNSVSAGAADRALQQWLGGSLLFDTAAARGNAPRVYVELVTQPSRAVRHCYLGEIGACRAALSIADSSDVLTRWYDPAERRDLVVQSYQGYFNQGAHQVDFRACAAGSDEACLHLLRTLPPWSLVRPLDYQARLSLLVLAIETGGAGAIARLLDRPDQDMSERVSAAAGISADSLTGRWIAMVRAARPTPVSLPPWGAWIALGWIGVFATCGLRSSRWRVS